MAEPYLQKQVSSNDAAGNIIEVVRTDFSGLTWTFYRCIVPDKPLAEGLAEAMYFYLETQCLSLGDCLKSVDGDSRESIAAPILSSSPLELRFTSDRPVSELFEGGFLDSARVSLPEVVRDSAPTTVGAGPLVVDLTRMGSTNYLLTICSYEEYAGPIRAYWKPNALAVLQNVGRALTDKFRTFPQLE